MKKARFNSSIFLFALLLFAIENATGQISLDHAPFKIAANMNWSGKSVSIGFTNTSNERILLFPKIDFFYSNSTLAAERKVFTSADAGAIGVAILCIGPARTDIPIAPPIEGQQPVPQDIAPGETKTITFSARIDPAAMFKEATSAEMYFILNKKIIASMPVPDFPKSK